MRCICLLQGDLNVSLPMINTTLKHIIFNFLRSKIFFSKLFLTHLSSSWTVFLMWKILAVPDLPLDLCLGLKSIFAVFTNVFDRCSSCFSLKKIKCCKWQLQTNTINLNCSKKWCHKLYRSMTLSSCIFTIV